MSLQRFYFQFENHFLLKTRRIELTWLQRYPDLEFYHLNRIHIHCNHRLYHFERGN